MGHRFSDLDCLGSAVAMAAAARSLGRPAYVVTQRDKTLARELLDRYDQAGRGGSLHRAGRRPASRQPPHPADHHRYHNPDMLEWPPLYQRASTVVVCDHHRKMVNHIENAVIFYHEPYSSSASEMVAELVQYMGAHCISRLEAEALLAGIMLDTRNFVMKAGVRTFEAAAYLRRQGPTRSRSSGCSPKARRPTARRRISSPGRRSTAAPPSRMTRTAAPSPHRGCPSRDELLSIKGVDAAFTLFIENGGVNVSARSLGDFNVQLVMEAIGGGGHLTMAGAYLRDTGMEEARRLLVSAIDAHIQTREQSLAAQLHQNESV